MRIFTDRRETLLPILFQPGRDTYANLLVIMSKESLCSYMRYTIPVLGEISLTKNPPMWIDDIYIEFIIEQRKLQQILVTAPLPQNPPKTGTLPNQAGGNDELRIWEPRAREIEEILLHAANVLSTVHSVSVEILFHERKIEWLDEYEDGLRKRGMEMDFGGSRKGNEPTRVAFELLSRALIAGRVFGVHDPSFTFYMRGMADILEKRHIEAFYNFYFFLEFDYIHGKSSPKRVAEELLKSEELVAAAKKVLAEKRLKSILHKSFVEEIDGAAPVFLDTELGTIRV